MGTTGQEHVSAVPQVFMGRWGAHQTPRKLGRHAGRPALSPGEPIPGSSGRAPRRTRATVKEKENPPWGPHRRPWAPLRRRVGPSPAVGSGILTRFPFGRGATPSACEAGRGDDDPFSRDEDTRSHTF